MRCERHEHATAALVGAALVLALAALAFGGSARGGGPGQYLFQIRPRATGALGEGSINASYGPARVAVSLAGGRITLRVRPWQEPQVNVSGSTAIQRLAREGLGPETFLLQLAGPQVAAALSRYQGNGTYFFDPPLHAAGAYDVTVLHLYTGYAALQETEDAWPPLIRALVWAGGGVLLAGCCCRPGAGHWLVSGGARARALVTRYTGIRYHNNVSDDFDARSAALAGAARWGTCSSPAVDYAAAPAAAGRACVAGKHIRFVGDSHMRVFFSAVASLYKKEWEWDLKGAEGHVWEDKGTNTKITYNSNPFGGGFEETDDVTVFNFGNHPASGDHWTFDQYKAQVDALWDAIKGFTLRNLIWAGTNPIPLRTDHNVQHTKDWRTLVRIELFNNLTTEFFSSKGIRVLDVFPIYEPFLALSRDNAHWMDTPALNATVAMLLELLCPGTLPARPGCEGEQGAACAAPSAPCPKP